MLICECGRVPKNSKSISIRVNPSISIYTQELIPHVPCRRWVLKITVLKFCMYCILIVSLYRFYRGWAGAHHCCYVIMFIRLPQELFLFFLYYLVGLSWLLAIFVQKYFTGAIVFKCFVCVYWLMALWHFITFRGCTASMHCRTMYLWHFVIYIWLQENERNIFNYVI